MLDYLPMILFILVVAVPVAMVAWCLICGKKVNYAAAKFRSVYYQTLSTLEVEHEREVLRREKLWALAEVRTVLCDGFGLLAVEFDKKRRYCEKIEAIRYPSVHLANKLQHVLAVAKGKKDPDSVDRDCPSCWR